MGTATEEPIVKLNGNKVKEIESLVEEYVGYHKLVDSPDPKLRIDTITPRQTRLGNIRSALERTISSAVGEDKVISNGESAEKIIDDLVAKAYDSDLTLKGKVKLPDAKGDPQGRMEAKVKYLKDANVDYTQLTRALLGIRGSVKIETLPDGHPLKTLINYMTNHSDKDQKRLVFIQEMLVSTGDVHAPTVAEAFNKYGGTGLDPKFAKPQEAIQNYQLFVQAELAKYDAKDPNKAYNKAIAQKAFEHAVGAGKN
ncbi:hypothetical protein HYX00_03455 [Candidatus Woesearchaeota archaeon]|nr:hypothetical protein [Candidatus Woesearchaeota archaeon]